MGHRSANHHPSTHHHADAGQHGQIDGRQAPFGVGGSVSTPLPRKFHPLTHLL